MRQWFDISATEFVAVLLSVMLLYSAVLALTRLFGLRSFSKMSSGDFAMTIAVGSILGSAIANPNPSVLVAAVALAGLFAGQWLLAWARRSFEPVQLVVDNQPLLLMRGSEVLEDNLKRAQVSHSDLRAKLREANVLRLSQIAAVVFETTGDVSVLHSNDELGLDDFVMAGVHGYPAEGSLPR